MNAYVWWGEATVPRPPANPHQPPKPAGRATYADHVRGRVRKVGKTWHLEVVNTRTGKVLSSDRCNVWAPIRDEADRQVGVARWAAFYGFAKKSVDR